MSLLKSGVDERDYLCWKEVQLYLYTKHLPKVGLLTVFYDYHTEQLYSPVKAECLRIQ